MADGPPSIPGIPTDPSVAEVLGTCADAQVPCGPVYAIDEIFDDPQYAARGNIAMVPTRIADMANVMPRLTGTPGAIDWAGKPLASDNESVFQGLLGLSDEEIAAPRDKGVI
jgi:crotonobetainyl-CoA:carnitine CoA-transferase CaiB-like acyl-CoA transferase